MQKKLSEYNISGRVIEILVFKEKVVETKNLEH